MKRFRTLLLPILSLVLYTLPCNTSQATIVIDVGDHVVLPNTPGQAFDVLVSSDPGDSLVSGMELHVEIGDGFDGVAVPVDEPVFNGTPGTRDSIDFSTSIFLANTPSGEGPVAGGPSLVDAGVTTPADVVANGVLVTLVVDTSGYSTPGVIFPVTLSNHQSPFPSDTLLLGPIGNSVPLSGVVINNGSIRIGVPEPVSASIFMSGIGGLFLVGRRGRVRTAI